MWTGVTYIWINFNRNMNNLLLHYKMWNKITFPFPNFNVQLLKFGNNPWWFLHKLIHGSIDMIKFIFEK